MRFPDFFIVGAPKCGTTSLVAWLAAHPQIFMAPVKEPHFFNTDDRQGVTTLADYAALFRAAGDGHAAVGEASVWYLSSAAAIGNILRHRPAARFIVLLRSPVEMAPALHAEMVLSGHENVRDFRRAWDLQDERRAGRCLPPFTWAQRRLQYGEACALGAQMQRLVSVAGRARVLAIVLDDMAADPRQEYRRALRFLGVADDGRQDFPVHNTARALRHPILTRALFVASQVKNRAGLDLHLGLWERLARANTLKASRPPLTAETVQLLRDHFHADIRLLGDILERDLRPWLATGQPAPAPPRRRIAREPVPIGCMPIR